MGKLSEPIKSSIFTLLQHLGDEKAFKTLKLFIFIKKILICLFPTNIRDFKQKSRFLAKNQQKMVGNRQNQKCFGKTDKVKTFV